MAFTPLDWIAFIAFIGLWFVQTAFDTNTWAMASGARNENRAWYERGRQYVGGAPPSWLFGLVWSLLYALNGLAGFFFWKDASSGPITGSQYDTVLVLYLVNWLLQKLWSPVFFTYRRVLLALIIMFLVLGTAVTTLVLFGLYGQWTAFGLYVPYALWLLYALYLNSMWSCMAKNVYAPGAARPTPSASSASVSSTRGPKSVANARRSKVGGGSLAF